MGRKSHSPKEIVNKLRHAEVDLGKGKSNAEVCKHLDISEPPSCVWRREYGGLKVALAKRFKAFEQENAPRGAASRSLNRRLAAKASPVRQRMVPPTRS